MKKSILAATLVALMTPMSASANVLPGDISHATKFFLAIGALTVLPILINTLIEIVVGLIFTIATRRSYVILFYQFIANIISFIIFYFAMDRFNFTKNYISLIVGELIVIIVETIVIKWLSRDRMSAMQAFTLSLVANIASAVTGIILSEL